MNIEHFFTLGIALGLGLLVGLQRERSGSKVAGIRTFPLITFLGSLSALLAQEYSSGWLVVAGMISLALLLASVNVARGINDRPMDTGQTTETAALVMFALGAYLVVGSQRLAIAVGAVVAMLLYLKGTIGQFVGSLAPKDVRAVMQFAAISLIVLPVLPNETYGPYEVLNPREVWWMVVLIVGIGLTGYFIYKWVGKSAGVVIGGILGGLISSTATTVAYARRTKSEKEAAHLAAFIIVTASAVAFVRVFVEISVVAPQFLGVLGPPIAVVFLIIAILALGFYIFNQRKAPEEEMPEPDNPAQLKSALIFGVLYAVILLAVAVVKDHFGHGGLYIVSLISGLTDMDAITLSLANTLKNGDLEAVIVWKLIILAGLANLFFKGSMAAMLGSRTLGKYVGMAFALTIIAGLLVIWLWPENWQIR